MMKRIRERIFAAGKALGYTNTSRLANALGMSQSTLSKFENAEEPARSSEIILNFVEKFQDIDCNWLLRGTGSMMIEPKEVQIPTETTEETSPAHIYHALYEEKNKECLELAKHIGKLEAQIESLKK